jgi:Flp pilus assembly protein CpaB
VVEIAQNLFTTRRGSLLIGAAAAIVAGVILLVYLHAYRNSVNGSAANVSVLVAKNLIPKGTPGNIIGASDQFQVAQVPKSQLQTGALVDPSALAGRIALTDIYPNQQLTAAAFAYAAPGTLQTNIAGVDRAMSVSIDSAHGMVGQVAAGDHIDVYWGAQVAGPSGARQVMKLLFVDVPVLRAPLAGGSGLYTLKVSSRQAPALAYAADNGRLWFALRPASGAKTAILGPTSLSSLLAGFKPVR